MSKIIWREIKEGEQVVMLVATYKGAGLVVMPSGVWSVTSAQGASAGSMDAHPESMRQGLAMDKAALVVTALMRGAK